jgi:GR25 family glycosyltransferase involved in LPS biosynthesis
MFTKILYINLERRPDRDIHIKEQLKKINWNGPVERIEAVDGKNTDMTTIKYLLSDNAYNSAIDTTPRKFRPGNYMTKGAVGCALSHRKAWLNVLNNNDDKVLILEDDIYFDNNFTEKISEYLESAPDYDILYLGFHHTYTNNSIKINDDYNIPNSIVFGLYGYIIDKRIVSTLLGMFPINKQIDSEIFKIYNEVKVYHLDKHKCIIYSEDSLINSLGTDIQLIEGFTNITKRKSKNILLFLLLFILIIYFIKVN